MNLLELFIPVALAADSHKEESVGFLADPTNLVFLSFAVLVVFGLWKGGLGAILSLLDSYRQGVEERFLEARALRRESEELYQKLRKSHEELTEGYDDRLASAKTSIEAQAKDRMNGLKQTLERRRVNFESQMEQSRYRFVSQEQAFLRAACLQIAQQLLTKEKNLDRFRDEMKASLAS